MPKQSSKTQDLNQIAASVLIDALGNPPPIPPAGKKNPAAVALKPVVGLKAGTARAVTPPSKRSKAAKKAATVDAGRKLTRKPS